MKNAPPAADAGDLPYWLALYRAPLVGSLKFSAVLKRFGSPRTVFESGRSDWQAAGLPDRTIAFLRQPDWEAVANDLKWLEVPGRHCLVLGQPDYPDRLAEIPDPPPVLFLEGDPRTLSARHIAMVGSRNPSPAGVRTAREFAGALVARGLGIVSGLALGIDAASHQGALAGGGITVAVTGAGPDRIYPRQHEALAGEIVSDGALVTEFPPGTEPRAQNFPRRNRIISGLSIGTLVVEAALRSGSLITARLAVEQNREVFAIPGSIDNPLARGCNDLIQLGAKLVQSVDDILEEFEFAPASLPGNQPVATDFDGNCPCPELLKNIAYGPTSVDTLVAVTGNTAEAIASQLLLLELQGFVASAPGGGYVRLK